MNNTETNFARKPITEFKHLFIRTRWFFPLTVLVIVVATTFMAVLYAALARNSVRMAQMGAVFTGLSAVALIALLSWKFIKVRKTEKATRFAYNELDQIFDTAGDGMRVVDKHFNVVRINHPFSLLSGISKEEAVGKKCYEAFYGSNCHTSGCPLTRILDGEEYYVSDAEKRRCDGTIVSCIVTATPFRAPDGEIIGIVEDFKDITDRKQAEEALREQKEFAENMVRSSSIPTFVLDAHHNVIIWNRACEELTGMKASEMVGTGNHWQAFYDQARPCLADIIIDRNYDDLPKLFSLSSKSEILSEGLHGERWFIKSGGRKRYVVVDAAPVYNRKGELVAAIETLQDITGRKLAEEVLEEHNRRIRNELELAHSIQASLLPINLPRVAGVTLAASAVAANEVGGDYCDLFVTKHNKLGIAIGDVMGKGIPAALFVAMTYAYVRNFAGETDSPSALVNRVNRVLFPQLETTQQFITFFYGIYDPASRQLVYANAGHNPPLVYRAATGETETLQVRSFFMGGREDASYKEGRIVLEPGDVVLFYTDGLKEGRNPEKELFGLDRITRLLKENYMTDPASIQEIIFSEFKEFLAGEPPYDDVTMIVLKIDESKI